MTMLPNEDELINDEKGLSQTGPNELNEEDLGLSNQDEDTKIGSGQTVVADNENDTMDDPENDLDEEEVQRLFPGDPNPDKDDDLDDLNETV